MSAKTASPGRRACPRAALAVPTCLPPQHTPPPHPPTHPSLRRYIADPSMHSMPAITPNPTNTAIICQSLDNQVGAWCLVMCLSVPCVSVTTRAVCLLLSVTCTPLLRTKQQAHPLLLSLLPPPPHHTIALHHPLQIVTYLTKDRFKQNRKKTFKGHNTAGYACQVNFSPDAKYVMSGESLS